MSTSSDQMRNSADSPHVAAYKEVRAGSKSWFPKIMKHHASKAFDLHRAARKLGLAVEDRTIVFDDENETAVLMDYFLVDYRLAGKSVAESCLFAPGELTPVEAEYHQVMLASRTSLFAISTVHDHEPQILLRDLLEPESPEIWLTDIGFAASIPRFRERPLIYTRVVSIRGLHITGGFSFIFAPAREFALVDGCRRALWSVSAQHHEPRRTSFFLEQHRRHGLPMALEDPS